MARRYRNNGGSFADKFAKGFTDGLAAISRWRYYQALSEKQEAETARLKGAPSNESVMDHINKFINGDGDSSSSSSSGGSRAAALTSELIKAEAAKRMDYLVNEKKIDPKIAAGIVSNDFAESTFNPTIKGDGGDSFGSFQFNKNGEMPYFQKWADANRRDPNDWKSHYDFVTDDALKGRHKGVYDSMMKAPDAQGASIAFSRGFERPNPKYAREDVRASAAGDIAQGWKGVQQRTKQSEARYKPDAVKSEALPPLEKKEDVAATPSEKKEDSAIPARPPIFTRMPGPTSTETAETPKAPEAPEVPATAEQPPEEPQKTGALDLPDPFAQPDITLFSATGGPVPDVDEGSSLNDAISAALKGMQEEYGLGRENAALPGTDIERQQGLESFARNEGAMLPEEMEKVVRAVDPRGELPRGEANSLALQKLYDFYSKQGSPEEAQSAASAFVQGTRVQSTKLGSLAVAAMEKGDMAGAGKALIESYNQIPDGKTVTGEVDQSGNGMAVIKDSRTGKTVEQFRITPKILQVAAQKLANGSEFYSHLIQHAAPARPAQRMAGGGLAGDWGPEEGETYDREDPDEQLRRDAALATGSDSSGNGDGGDDEESALPTGSVSPRMNLPKQPEVIPYMQGMTAEQRRYVDRVNSARQTEWKSQVSAHQKSVTDEVIRRRGEESANRRMAFQESQSNKRTEFQEAQNTARMTQQERMQAARQAEADRQARLREQERQAHEVRQSERGRYNGMTEEDMRNETSEANKPIISSIRDLTEQAVNGRPREYALPTEAGAAPAIPGEGVQMPDGLNTPRTGDEAMRAVGGAFDREFGLSPGDKAKAIQTRGQRDQAIMDRDFKAADVGARAYAKDRPGLEKALDDIFDDKDEGLFTRNLKDGEKAPKGATLRENGRLYFGDKVSPAEKSTLKTFAFKMAQANPDLPVSSAAHTVMRLTGVDDKNPDAAPNFKINIDPKTGAGRVSMNDGSVQFNLDGESLKQVLLFRQSKALQIKGRLAAEAGEKEKSEAFYRQGRELAGALADKASEIGGSFWDEAVVKNPVIGGAARVVGGATEKAGRYVGKKFVDTYSDPSATPASPEMWSDPSGYGAIPISPR